MSEYAMNMWKKQIIGIFVKRRYGVHPASVCHETAENTVYGYICKVEKHEISYELVCYEYVKLTKYRYSPKSHIWGTSCNDKRRYRVHRSSVCHETAENAILGYIRNTPKPGVS